MTIDYHELAWQGNSSHFLLDYPLQLAKIVDLDSMLRRIGFTTDSTIFELVDTQPNVLKVKECKLSTLKTKFEELLSAWKEQAIYHSYEGDSDLKIYGKYELSNELIIALGPKIIYSNGYNHNHKEEAVTDISLLKAQIASKEINSIKLNNSLFSEDPFNFSKFLSIQNIE